MLSSIISRSKSAQRNDTPSAGVSITPLIDATTTQAKIYFLNQSLETLHELFPAGDIEEIRRLLATSSEESRLYVVTEMLLKRGGSGSGSGGQARARAGELEQWEKFRSDEYQRAVKKALYKEFRGLPKSTVQAVMAEHNFMYSRAQVTLSGIAAKSWRFSLSNLFRRSPRSPSLLELNCASTGCKELDDELHELGRGSREAQIAADRTIAARLNEAEHAAVDELLECECCFGDYAWEEIVACTEGHFFCYTCLTRSVQESVYGQGKSLLDEKCSVRCLSSSAQPPCTEYVPCDVLRTVLPEELYYSLEDRTASECLEKSGLKLVKCPFCSYAEVDELQPYRLKRSVIAVGTLCVALAGLLITVLFPPVVGCLLLLFFLSIFELLLPKDTPSSTSFSLLICIEKATRKVNLRRRGALFKCENTRCKRESCITCTKEWAPFHKCYEKEEDAARVYVEKAMADAVKRTCPICHVSFVKADGCNKLTCPCGYIMCYICRVDIRDEGYKHFCQHFRQIPGTACPDCNSCDLYANEDEAVAIRRAAKSAEEEYWRRNGKPKGWSWRTVGGPVAAEVGSHSASSEVRKVFAETAEGIVEWVVDCVLEFGE